MKSEKKDFEKIFEDLDIKFSQWTKCNEKQIELTGIKKGVQALQQLKNFLENQIETDSNKITKLKEYLEKVKHGGNVG